MPEEHRDTQILVVGGTRVQVLAAVRTTMSLAACNLLDVTDVWATS